MDNVDNNDTHDEPNKATNVDQMMSSNNDDNNNEKLILN